ncbi:RADX protein, partial [Corythaeola cristata]|nr:RADX protein [Corythaeola cristata]
SKLTSLGQLEMTWRSRVHFHPLLVRVLHKSRLRYYGKPEKKLDMPYQAYFEVADGSGMMSMVLWNSLCPEWYNSMKVGTVLLLEQYAIKTSYPFKTQPTPGDSQMKRFATIVTITFLVIYFQFLIPSNRNFPVFPYNHSPVNVGKCTWRVSKATREGAFQIENSCKTIWHSGIFLDFSEASSALLASVCSCSILFFFSPVTYLVCTQMRVVRDLTENPSSTIYLTTSNESQIFITGWHKGQPYTKDTKVKNFIQWTKTQSEADQMKKTVIGGYYPFPRPPNNFLKY